MIEKGRKQKEKGRKNLKRKKCEKQKIKGIIIIRERKRENIERMQNRKKKENQERYNFFLMLWHQVAFILLFTSTIHSPN